MSESITSYEFCETTKIRNHIYSEQVAEVIGMVSVDSLEVTAVTPYDHEMTDQANLSVRERIRNRLHYKPSAEDSVGQYLDWVGRYPLLTASEEVELSRRIRIGSEASEKLASGTRKTSDLLSVIVEGEQAKQQFITSNLRLVVSIAKKYPQQRGMELLDLIQEGNLGLEHAVIKFDGRKGFRFSTYAVKWIKQAIGRGLDQKGSLIRLPGDNGSILRAALKRCGGDWEQLTEELRYLYCITDVVSMDASIGGESETDLHSLLPEESADPAQIVADMSAADTLKTLLELLTPKERRAIEIRHGLEDNIENGYKEVGQRLNMTANGARLLVLRAEEKLRKLILSRQILID